ncbi:MAG: phytanoyl-CoA dioxygenase family protein [Longimicrobiaceae bacterium]
MDDPFAALAARPALAPELAAALDERGFVVIPGAVADDAMPRLQAAYDDAVARADGGDVGVGRTTTRVNDFVNRGPAFDDVYTWPPVLDACRRVIGRPFRLSALHARTLRAGAAAQELHADIPRDSDAWPMVGLILMIDDFRADNGATRFVPGSHRWPGAPAGSAADLLAPHPGEVLACGPAGSAIVFDASTWHGHTANTSGAPRRSLQATFIPRDGRAATDFAARMRPETLARLGPAARYLLGIDTGPGRPA